MAKQLNVNLNFNANTEQARNEIIKLQTQLNSLTTTTTAFPMTDQILGAQQAAGQLKVALSQAFNVDTGKFDILKFNQSIQKSGTSLEEMRNRLVSIGPTGQQAFLSLAQSIANAEIPTRRISALFTELGVTLKNTLKWQLSSSVLHGFIGAVQGAYGYAQDLNKSLNEIRIVSGASVAEMDKFAEKANKAAKALSSSTLDYTNAALIYYQQGLDDKTIEERTAVTLKMANVSGQSAQEVSDQMTAVWNNFYDGSKSLEYYADVMTALGAATASSTDEIATGLQKFASSAETVGLSYEYATAALATVTSTTRESADVVGTAFKAIFARLQDLKLGKTLDDGTTLGNYSENLAKVGVNIKTASGELKDMDTILEETAAKWKTLDNDQQVALAKGVAGIRQYNSFMSLMNNWDFMEQNLQTVKDSGGELQKQSEIYAESWEAARDRVKAAAEALYSDLLKDDFFINMTNGFEKVLTLLDHFIDSIGGVKGLLFGLSSVLLNTFSGAAAQGLENMVYNLKSFIGLAGKEAMATQNELLQLATSPLPTTAGSSSVLDTAQGSGSVQASQEQVRLSQELAQLKEKMTVHQQEEAQYILAQNKAYGDQLIVLGQKLDQANADKETAGQDLFDEAGFELGAERAREAMANIDKDIDFGDTIVAEVQQAEEAFKKTGDMDAYKAKLAEIKQMVKEQGGFESVEKMLDGRSAPHKANLTEDVGFAAKKDIKKNATDHLKENKSSAGPAADVKTIDKYIEKSEKAVKANKKFVNGQKDLNRHSKQASNQLKNLTKTTQSLSTQIVRGAQAAMSLSYAFSAISNVGDIWKSKDLSTGQKLLQTMMSLGTAIPMLINGLKGLNTVLGITTLKQQHQTLSAQALLAAKKSELATLTAEKVAKMSKVPLDQAELMLSKAKAAAKLEELKASGANLTAMTAEQLAEKTGMTVDAAAIVLSKLKSGASLTEAMSEAGLTTAKTAGIGAAIASAVAKGVETGAIWAQVVANIALATSMSPVLIVTIALTVALVALVAIVAGIVAAFQHWKASSPEGQLKAATEESARLSGELDKARESSEKLKESIEGYDSAVKKISELKEGTEEWRDAINEANDKAREIIEMGGMEGKYSFNANTGLIEFEDGALEDAQELADQQVKKVQAQKLMADNAVISAQQKVDTKDFVKGNGVSNKNETAAMEALYKAYEQAGGNFTQAMDSLSDEQQELLNGLDATGVELEKLCQASRDNTAAILANNKQIVDAQFSGTETYDESSNKDFLNELMTEDMTAEAEKLYEEKYKDGGEYSDKEAQKEYAKLMGWDENLVKNKSGNKAVYVNEEGEEVTISDAQVRQYLAQQEALENLNGSVDEYAEKVEKLERKEDALAESYERGAISYEEYVKQMKAAGKELGLSNEQIDSYIEKHADDSIKFSAKAQEKMGLKGYEADALSNYISGAFEDNTIINSEEAMKIALDVAATSESLDDFARQFEVAVTDALIGSLETSSAGVKTMMDTADENGGFSGADLDSLADDDTFLKWLEDNSMSMTDIISASYTEQYNIMARYYSDLTQMQYEAFETQKENYENDVSEYQAIIDYKRSLDEGSKADAEAVKAAWGDRIDFEAYADMDISDLESKLEEAKAGIEEMTNKQYEINVSWDGVDQLEKSFDEMGDFASMMEKDVKKVGKSYQMTAAQGRKWMEMYPELFSTATVTTDGLIQLSEEEYQAFADAEKQKRDEAIQTEIDNMKLRLEAIPEERARLETQLQMYTSLAEGKINLEGATAEDLAAMRDNLTQFYIDSGLDEAAANAEALKAMGLSQEQYNQMVADSSEANSKNMTNSVKKGVENIKKLFYNLITNLKGVFTNLGNAIKAIFTGDWSSIGTYMSASWNAAKGTVEGVKNDYEAIKSGTIDNYKIGNQYTSYKTKAEFEEARTNNLNKAISDIQASMAKLDKEESQLKSKILYLEGMKNQDVSEFGSTDPDDVDETDKDKDKKDKDSKDLLETAERYHEITRELEAMEHQLELVGKEKDRAFGVTKIRAMEDEIKLLEKMLQKQNELYKAQQVFLALDRMEVESAFKDAEFNEDGEISNYSALTQKAADELNAARVRYNNSAQEDADKELLDKAEQKYEDDIAILEQYEETLTKTRESQLAVQEAFDAIQSANAEKLSYNLELKMILNDDELKQLDYYLNKTEDDMYQRAEGLALINKQVDVHGQKMQDYKDQVADLDAALQNGDINQTQYIEKMTEVSDGLYEELEALQELDKQMLEYYGETLQMASEEIDKVTDQMEHHNSVLSHYLTLLELMGKSADYKTIGVVLEGQAEVSKNAMIAARKEYETFQKEADAKYLAWKSATDEASAEMLKKQYEDALAISTEKQEEYLSLAEEYAESLKSILENSLKQYAQDLENALTGGTSFDEMNTKLERAAAIQEEYLTTTNKIYETNKMMNTAQQEIDKTTNTVAKQKLKQFIDETNQLQKKNKLSQYELDIQQAKYDLLLAEIALEDAQNAKSSVRLQRDSEGNFGYVYTADQDKIAEAQQKLADAQNSLYNIALEGSNDYFTKYQETMSEMYDYFTELHQRYLDGEFESEQEYQNAVAEAKQYYYDMLEQYSDLYTIAISTDARALEDAWSSEFNSMVYNTKNWQTQVDIYIQKSQQSFSNYAKQIDTLAGELGVSGSYDEIADSVGNVVDENEALLNTLLSPGGVFDTLESEIALVNDVAAAYATERASVLELIKTYEALTLAIINAKRAEAGKDPLDSIKLPTNNAEQDTAVDGSAEPNGGDGTPKVGDKVKYNSGKYYNSSDGQSPTGTAYQGSEVYITKINTADWAKYPYHISVGNQLYKGDLGWLKLNQISGYDTGGYTGRWGSYGKLAMLHEKEIVLNKQDTENFLQSMEFLDNIVQTIDLYSANQQISGMLNSPSFGKLGSDTLEQKVEIEAHFPNVSSRVEIEEAFATLVNRASQYVNRN